MGAMGPVQPRAGGSLFRPESQGRRNVPSAVQACGGKALSALLSEILDIFSWTRQKVTVFVSLKTFCPDSRHLPMPARRHGAPLAVTSVAMSAGMRGGLAGLKRHGWFAGKVLLSRVPLEWCRRGGAAGCVRAPCGRDLPRLSLAGQDSCGQAPASPLERTRAMG